MQKESKHIDDTPQEEFIAALKSNNEQVMKAFYITNFEKVKSYVLQNSGSLSDAKDVYQEAFITVWKNVRSDAFTPQSESSLSGYLYQIAKNKWLDLLRSPHYRKVVSESRIGLVSRSDDAHSNENRDAEKKNIEKIMTAFGHLDKHCKDILQQFYFHRKSYRVIAKEKGMKEASVRNQKYRCMQKLNGLVQKINQDQSI